jgi:hypothetical protein
VIGDVVSECCVDLYGLGGARCGRKLSSAIASSTRRRVVGRTCGLPRRTSATVFGDTRARTATSLIVAARDRCGHDIGTGESMSEVWQFREGNLFLAEKNQIWARLFHLLSASLLCEHLLDLVWSHHGVARSN